MIYLRMIAVWLMALTASPAGAVLQKIHRIDTFGSNVFLLETDSSLFMIDAGYPGYTKKILKKIVELHKQLKLIIITHGHFDHYGCAAKMKEATGARIAIHELDAEHMCKGTTPLDSVNFVGFFGRLILPLAEKIFPPDRMCPDILLHDGDSLDSYGLRARVVLTSGHTKGSCCIIVEDSIVFVGDLLTNYPNPDRQSFYANSWGQIDSSLRRLGGEKFTVVYMGHTGTTTDKKTLLKIAAKKK